MAEYDLSDADTDDLARAYKKALRDLEDQKEYVKMLAMELGHRSLDQPDKMLKTAYGKFQGSYRAPYRRWDKDDVTALATEVFIRARDGELHEPNAEGEVPGTPEWRVKDALMKMFSLKPRIGYVKSIGLDPDEYSETEGKGYWSVTVRE